MCNPRLAGNVMSSMHNAVDSQLIDFTSSRCGTAVLSITTSLAKRDKKRRMTNIRIVLSFMVVSAG